MTTLAIQPRRGQIKSLRGWFNIQKNYTQKLHNLNSVSVVKGWKTRVLCNDENSCSKKTFSIRLNVMLSGHEAAADLSGALVVVHHSHTQRSG